MAMSYDKTRSVYAQLTSRIDKVKVYAVGATVTRVADLQINAEEIPEHVEIAGLPLALDDSSVRVPVESNGDTTAIATDVRIGLAVPPRQEIKNSPTEEEVREAKAEVQRIEDAIALILSIPTDGAKADIQIDRVSPDWEKYEQQERGAPIRGGYPWRVQVPAREQTMLSVDYTVKTFVDSELIGGNRRE
jgi:hypothetical protein